MGEELNIILDGIYGGDSLLELHIKRPEAKAKLNALLVDGLMNELWELRSTIIRTAPNPKIEKLIANRINQLEKLREATDNE